MGSLSDMRAVVPPSGGGGTPVGVRRWSRRDPLHASGDLASLAVMGRAGDDDSMAWSGLAAAMTSPLARSASGIDQPRTMDQQTCVDRLPLAACNTPCWLRRRSRQLCRRVGIALSASGQLGSDLSPDSSCTPSDDRPFGGRKRRCKLPVIGRSDGRAGAYLMLSPWTSQLRRCD